MKYRSPRYATRYPIELVFGDDRWDCTVSSISTTGACITDEIGLHEGLVIKVDYSFGTMLATVKWVLEGEAGIEFERSLTSDELSRIRFALNSFVAANAMFGKFTEMR